MDRMVYIYGLIDPTTKELRYVGKSINPENRFRKHISERNTHDSYKDRWVRKLYENDLQPEMIIIDEVTENEWVFWEQHYISYFKFIGCNLTNGTIGGDQPPSTKGRKMSDSEKSHQSSIRKGKPIPWMNTGEPRSNKHKANLSKSLKGRISPNKGKQFSDEHKTNLSESHIGLFKGENHPMYGKSHTDETKNKLSEFFKKPIIQLSKEGVLIKKWSSIKEATEELKINNISACCNKKLKTAGGFKWKYIN